jgi:hypothetical protein
MEPSSTTITELFDKLLTRYGSAWRAKYAGISTLAVAADWAEQIGRFDRRAIQHALDNLPEFVPTSHQFRELCLRAPAQTDIENPWERIAAGRADPERVRAIVADLRAGFAHRSPTQWIFDLEARQAAGEKLSLFQKQCLANARRNLGLEGVVQVITEEDAERTKRLKAETQRKVDTYIRDEYVPGL